MIIGHVRCYLFNYLLIFKRLAYKLNSRIADSSSLQAILVTVLGWVMEDRVSYLVKVSTAEELRPSIGHVCEGARPRGASGVSAPVCVHRHVHSSPGGDL